MNLPHNTRVCHIIHCDAEFMKNTRRFENKILDLIFGDNFEPNCDPSIKRLVTQFWTHENYLFIFYYF